MAMGIIVLVFIIVVAWFGFSPISQHLRQYNLRPWLAGAGSLGLVSGLITGLSDTKGSGKAFMTFVGTGLLVPLLGGVATLPEDTNRVAEKSTYDNTYLVEKTTETISSLSDNFLDPVGVLGSLLSGVRGPRDYGYRGWRDVQKGRTVHIPATDPGNVQRQPNWPRMPD